MGPLFSPDIQVTKAVMYNCGLDKLYDDQIRLIPDDLVFCMQLVLDMAARTEFVMSSP